jgi:hypothetical protein
MGDVAPRSVAEFYSATTRVAQLLPSPACAAAIRRRLHCGAIGFSIEATPSRGRFSGTTATRTRGCSGRTLHRVLVGELCTRCPPREHRLSALGCGLNRSRLCENSERNSRRCDAFDFEIERKVSNVRASNSQCISRFGHENGSLDGIRHCGVQTNPSPRFVNLPSPGNGKCTA